MSVLLITSDRDGAGKTVSASAIALMETESGRSSTVFEQFEWGEGASLDERLRAFVSKLSDASSNSENLYIAELPSSIGPQAVSDAAAELDASALLVVAYRRDLNGEEFVEWKERLGTRLAGVLVNGLTRYLRTETEQRILPSFSSVGIECLGLIPEDRMMLSVSIEELRNGLNGRYVVDAGDTDRPIEWLQVGAMSLDPGEPRFALYENNAVIVRGDRPDIQMSALNGNAACLVLTGGIDPIQYILYEANEEETPVMVVESDTLSTMDTLAEVTASASMNSAAKTRRYAKLLETHADLDALRI